MSVVFKFSTVISNNNGKIFLTFEILFTEMGVFLSVNNISKVRQILPLAVTNACCFINVCYAILTI